jgi:hypothetical protein
MEAGTADHVWTINEIVALIDVHNSIANGHFWPIILTTNMRNTATNSGTENLMAMAERLRHIRSNQPKVTLEQAQAQAARVMRAAKNSPLRLQVSLSGLKTKG